MFNEYNPIDNKVFQIIDDKGKVINKAMMPAVSDEKLLKAYKDMLFARTADLQIVSYQRQGRIYTYPPNYGQEAISGAVGAIIGDNDWLVPAFREMGAMLAKGVTLKELFLYFMGYEDGSKFQNAKKTLPISVPIASQLLHAAGIGYEIKYNKKDEVVFAFVGDGGTSEGDFHEAVNFAGVWKVPVVFIIQNNQYGISTPTRMQTASESLAIKAVAYGVKGIKVDGNDYFAMYKAVEESVKACKNGEGPVLIEAVTYRKGAHTTSDDPTKYRTKEEEQQWESKDPLRRLKLYLEAKKLWSEKEEEKIIPQYKEEVDRQFIEAENYGPYPKEDVFKYLYAEMPDDLKEQEKEYERFLQWKASKVK
ncbi:MAG: pyruvate dehydrogenase (acetyl-transferring) E1 component subunit alpha [Bacteroidetes bacterium HGW-Bacteroidetes-14]|nr:MAG: pyruvate dehydrogenase (acetyl-transferring) E1 component subunit alpha [Bacteroidetes bacterium HGW-Bacteroidetes-14]